MGSSCRVSSRRLDRVCTVGVGPRGPFLLCLGCTLQESVVTADHSPDRPTQGPQGTVPDTERTSAATVTSLSKVPGL